MLTYVCGTEREWFAAVHDDGTVEVRNTASREVQRLSVRLDYAHARVALSADGRHVYAAHYEQHGVSCYEVRTGLRRWTRSDLRAQQAITLGAHDRVLAVGMNESPSYLLDAESGATLEVLDAEAVVWCDSESKDLVFRNARGVFLRSGGVLHQLATRTNGLVAVVFTPDAVWLSEAQASLACFARGDGNLRLRAPTPADFHAVPVAVRAGRAELRAVVKHLKHGHVTLCALNAARGTVRDLGRIEPSLAYAFVAGASVLATTAGILYDADSAHVVERLVDGD